MEDSSSAAVMDKWRNYLQNTNADIFEIIKKAIIMAASDHPQEFRLKRDKIAQTLYSCELIKCHGCDHCNKQSVNASRENDDQETKTVAEVTRIKEILDKSCSKLVMCELLMKLKHMRICLKTLEATGIGKTIRVFQKHPSKDVCGIARILMKEWKGLVDEWIINQQSSVKEKATSTNVTTTTISTNSSMEIKIKINLPNTNINPNGQVIPGEQSNVVEHSEVASRFEEKYEATKRKMQQGNSNNMMKKKKRGHGGA